MEEKPALCGIVWGPLIWLIQLLTSTQPSEAAGGWGGERVGGAFCLVLITFPSVPPFLQDSLARQRPSAASSRLSPSAQAGTVARRLLLRLLLFPKSLKKAKSGLFSSESPHPPNYTLESGGNVETEADARGENHWTRDPGQWNQGGLCKDKKKLRLVVCCKGKKKKTRPLQDLRKCTTV